MTGFELRTSQGLVSFGELRTGDCISLSCSLPSDKFVASNLSCGLSHLNLRVEEVARSDKSGWRLKVRPGLCRSPPVDC